MNKFIALVGMCGAGKSVVADELVRRGYNFFRFGQITLDIIKERGMEVSEENEKKIRESVRQEHGMGAYAILNQPKIDKFLKEGNVVGDGLYSWDEYKILKEKYGEQFYVIALYTPPETRYNRLETRKLDDNDKEARHRPLTQEQAHSRDFAEIENSDKGGPIAMADFTIINTGSIQDLFRDLEEVLAKIEERSPERLTWDEYFVEIMHAVAKRATCDRGRSGCVIVKDKQILVSGYVGSPKGLPHCDEVGHQMRTTIHEDGSQSQHCVRTAHAEQNAICQAARLGIPIDGATLYCKMTPCAVCAKMIINVGVKRVVCEKKYHAGKESEEMFKQAGITLEFLNDEVEQYKNQ